VIEADLHVHSDHSDGIYPPARVVEMAVAAGLKAIALTDHDTVDGVGEALDSARSMGGLEVVSGVELSSTFRGREIHLLAYDIDHTDPGLADFLAPMRHQRRLRAERIVARLNELGVPVTMDEVQLHAGRSGTGSIGRPHIADAIVAHKAAADIDDAFARFLRRGQPAYVARAFLEVGAAVRQVHLLGGTIVVAHPALNLGEGDTEALAREGLDGIEVWHPKHAADQRERLLKMTRRLGLVASGGSDYHGPGRNRHELASAGVPMRTLDELRERAIRRGKG